MIIPGVASKVAINVCVSIISSESDSETVPANAQHHRRAKPVRHNSLFGGESVNSHCRATHSVENPRPAKGFPSAVRQLLVHPEHHATKVHRRTTRRCDNRHGVRTPLDFPATIQKNHF